MEISSLNMAELIPHQDAMCLLDGIEHWDDHHIVCRATSHRRRDNPLRDGSGLRAVCALEYGAQAIAAHAALLGRPGGHGAEAGALVAVRDLITTLSHLDEIAGVLTVRADIVLVHEQGLIYDVTVSGAGRILLSGRLSVMTSPKELQTVHPLPAEGPA